LGNLFLEGLCKGVGIRDGRRVGVMNDGAINKEGSVAETIVFACSRFDVQGTYRYGYLSKRGTEVMI
jgi:hypothetical protein